MFQLIGKYSMPSDEYTQLLDTLLQKLLNFYPTPQDGNPMILTEEEIYYIIDRIVEEKRQQSGLVEAEAPITICGDTHGQYRDLLSLFEHCGWPPKMRYLFLGN